MFTRITCAHCQTKLEVDADSEGLQIECPRCGGAVIVPPKRVGPGTTVGDFRIARLLGKGGMGEVYLARQLSMDRDVALKILPAALSANPEAKNRFLSEVHIAARLEHANIVTTYGAGDDNGVLYLAMSYVNGETIERRLKRDGPLPEPDALRLARDIATGLAYAWNTHHVLHRDIKPANIMVDEWGQTKLMDMGLSKSLDEGQGLTVTGQIMGTPNYMSPEQVEGRKELDYRTDIYSLGATLYHLLTGQIPFAGSSVLETLQKLASQPLQDPRELNPAISEPAVRLMERMLARKPDLRPASWEELLAEIDAVLVGKPERVSALEAGASMVLRAAGIGGRPRRLAWIAAGCTLAGLALAGGLVLVYGLRSSRPTPDAATAQVAPPTEPAGPAAAPGTAPAVAAPPVTPDAAAAVEPPGPGVATVAVASAVAVAVPPMAAGDESPHVDRRRGTMDQLRADADRLLAAGKPEDAIALVRDYAGPAADRTVTQRQELLVELQQRLAESQRRDHERCLEQARADLAALTEAAARDLLKSDATSARRRMAAAAQEATFELVASELEVTARLVEEVARLPDAIMGSFERDLGKEVSISLKEGREVLLIESVGATEVKVRKRVAGGTIGTKFGLSDLTLREKTQRAGGGSEPATPIRRGLLALDAGDTDEAATQFLASQTPLGNAMAAIVPRRPERAGSSTVRAGRLPPVADGRLQVPETAAQNQALNRVRTMFKDGYAGRGDAERGTLARRLLAQAYLTFSDPAGRYVLLTESEKLAARSGDLTTAVRAASELARAFAVDPQDERRKVLDLAESQARSAAALVQMAETWLSAADDAARVSDFGAALDAARAARRCAEKARSDGLSARAKAKCDEIDSTAEDRRRSQSAEESLAKAPDSPAANLTAGSFFCFTRSEWEKGLPMLAKGADAELRAIALMDLARPLDPQAKALLGDEWRALAGRKANQAVRDAMEERARYWYFLALPALTGVPLQKVEAWVNSVADWPQVPGRPMSVHLGRGVRLALVWLKPGEFRMGSPEAETGRRPDEGPLHTARVSRGLWAGRYEVTHEQWFQLMGSNPSGAAWLGSSGPVTMVSWDEATEFCRRLNERCALGDAAALRFRLPTEAEWEYACRADASGAYGSGNSEADLGLVAWYRLNSSNQTHLVGLKTPNAWGLYDLLGNVAEWCYDSPGPYAPGRVADPLGPLGESRATRGGSFSAAPEATRCASRGSYRTADRLADVGFRVCCGPVPR